MITYFNIPKLDSNLKDYALTKRLENIKFIQELPRNTLQYNSNERQLLIYRSPYNEILSIQYPGKESSKNKNANPLDFRPKMQFPTGIYQNDLSFFDIWGALFDLFTSNYNLEIIKVLACEFYKIALMLSHETLSPNTMFVTSDLNVNKSNFYISTKNLHIYSPCSESLNKLNFYSRGLLGMSWQSFLIYNDLLALNEDSKYYYREYFKTNNNDKAAKYIQSGIGRINTMFTHLSILSLIAHESTFTDILKKFTYGKGVAPLSANEVNSFLSNYMIPEV